MLKVLWNPRGRYFHYAQKNEWHISIRDGFIKSLLPGLILKGHILGVHLYLEGKNIPGRKTSISKRQRHRHRVFMFGNVEKAGH
jgi:hypothetical protein